MRGNSTLPESATHRIARIPGGAPRARRFQEVRRVLVCGGGTPLRRTFIFAVSWTNTLTTRGNATGGEPRERRGTPPNLEFPPATAAGAAHHRLPHHHANQN